MPSDPEPERLAQGPAGTGPAPDDPTKIDGELCSSDGHKVPIDLGLGEPATGQDGTARDTAGPDAAGPDGTARNQTGRDRTRQNATGQDATGPDG
ncbi:MAG TPA: hypothetical protein VGS62_01885, partial [Streptosporangiaceae bacterium]|nr:hypothetical protein [Streptosporangiaceae bacterium]